MQILIVFGGEVYIYKFVNNFEKKVIIDIPKEKEQEIVNNTEIGTLTRYYREKTRKILNKQ
ncbi:MAG: hypothetical protein ATN35_00890 [Epulopiscium sp. Nele67-Bin004]|nr:MAG: hypothetical protein ATN35_00890 [Epulopiscium sp. Nele67-Bin004]